MIIATDAGDEKMLKDSEERDCLFFLLYEQNAIRYFIRYLTLKGKSQRRMFLAPCYVKKKGTGKQPNNPKIKRGIPLVYQRMMGTGNYFKTSTSDLSHKDLPKG